jgi:hypothetical protein
LLFLGTNCNPFFSSRPLLLVFWELFSLTAGAAIPIGIAVGRQRLQDTTSQSLPQLQSKDLNRFSFAELGTLLD